MLSVSSEKVRVRGGLDVDAGSTFKLDDVAFNGISSYRNVPRDVNSIKLPTDSPNAIGHITIGSDGFPIFTVCTNFHFNLLNLRI